MEGLLTRQAGEVAAPAAQARAVGPHGDDQGALARLHHPHPLDHAARADRQHRRRSAGWPAGCSPTSTPPAACGCSASGSRGWPTGSRTTSSASARTPPTSAEPPSRRPPRSRRPRRRGAWYARARTSSTTRWAAAGCGARDAAWSPCASRPPRRPPGPVRSYPVDDPALHPWPPPTPEREFGGRGRRRRRSVVRRGDQPRRRRQTTSPCAPSTTSSAARRSLGREDMPHWSWQEMAGAWRRPDPGERQCCSRGRVDGRMVGVGVVYLAPRSTTSTRLARRQRRPRRAAPRPTAARCSSTSSALATDAGRTTLMAEAKLPFDEVTDHRYRRFAEAAGFTLSNVEIVRAPRAARRRRPPRRAGRRRPRPSSSGYRIETLRQRRSPTTWCPRWSCCSASSPSTPRPARSTGRRR